MPISKLFLEHTREEEEEEEGEKVYPMEKSSTAYYRQEGTAFHLRRARSFVKNFTAGSMN